MVLLEGSGDRGTPVRGAFCAPGTPVTGGHRSIVSGKPLCPRQRSRSEGVLRLSRKLIARRTLLGERAHQSPLIIGVLETVEKHVVDDLAVPHAISERARSRRYGALLMLSIPPATMTSALPARI